MKASLVVGTAACVGVLAPVGANQRLHTLALVSLLGSLGWLVVSLGLIAILLQQMNQMDWSAFEG